MTGLEADGTLPKSPRLPCASQVSRALPLLFRCTAMLVMASLFQGFFHWYFAPLEAKVLFSDKSTSHFIWTDVSAQEIIVPPSPEYVFDANIVPKMTRDLNPQVSIRGSFTLRRPPWMVVE
jgi:hypothetical protein